MRRTGAAEQLDHFAIERRDVTGVSARHQVVVDDDFLIDPVGRVGEVPTARRGEQRPWRVT
jgi:hypothetical protein